jgi:hypothetical protein
MYSYPSNYNKNFNPSGLPYSVMLAETLDFQARMTAAGGNLLSPVELNAINYWISQYKYYNLWDRMIAYYPLVGGNGGAGSVNSFTINLKSSSYTLLNGGGIFDGICNKTGFRNTGSTGNGSTVYWNTGLNDSVLDQNDKGMSCYIITGQLKTNIYDMGVVLAGYSYLHILAAAVTATNFEQDYYCGVIGEGIDIQKANPNPIGFYTGNCYKGLAVTYKNGNALKTVGKRFTTTGIAFPIFLGCAKRSDINAIEVSNRTYGSWAIHQAYTPAEEKQRAIIEQNFQNLLGRAVVIS